MKKNTLYILLLTIAVYFITSCSKEPLKLEFAVLDSTYTIDGKDYSTDYCSMQVLENPADNDSKIINIPVIRIRTKSDDPGAPIFFLNDGPGISNLHQIMPMWLIDRHDLVIIGYRGIDGSTNLDLPEFSAYFNNSNFLSENNIKQASKALNKGIKKLQEDFDVAQYNIYNIAKDVESARLAFQYEKINIYACGLGARIANIYSNISQNSIFRILMVHPKVYGSLSLSPKDIDDVLSYYDMESEKINNGLLFKETIQQAIDKLPNAADGYIFDKDKILFQIMNLLNRTNGAGLVNEACISSLNGNFESMIALNKLANNINFELNFGDYLIKSITSEYNPKVKYFDEYSYNSKEESIGSPLSKFIFSSYQNSGLNLQILSTENTNPSKIFGECLAYIANIDILSSELMVTKELKSKTGEYSAIIASDYCEQDLYTINIAGFSTLIADFLYIGNSQTFVPLSKEINLIPEKTLKQLALENHL